MIVGHIVTVYVFNQNKTGETKVNNNTTYGLSIRDREGIVEQRQSGGERVRRTKLQTVPLIKSYASQNVILFYSFFVPISKMFVMKTCFVKPYYFHCVVFCVPLLMGHPVYNVT